MRRIVIAAAMTLALLLAAAFLIFNASKVGQNKLSEPTRLPVPLETTRLPQPIVRGNMSVEEALSTRRSVREYSSTDLSDNDLSQIVWAAQGITSPQGFQVSAFSGGAVPHRGIRR